MSTNTSNTSATNTSVSSSENNELTLEIPVWVHGKRKWVTGITKKTTFDDLIYALLAQAELLKASATTNSSSTCITGYAIAECIQLTAASPSSNTNNESEAPSLLTQRVLKGRGKVIKSYKNWQFDKLPLTILHLIPTSLLTENNSSKFRSKIFRRFLSSKSPLPSLIPSSQSDSSLISIASNNSSQTLTSYRQKSLNDFHENSNIIERQKRLLDYLDEKIHQAEHISSSNKPFNADSTSMIKHEVSLNDVSRLFSHQIDQQDQLIFATQLCNSILNMQERIDEKTNILYAVEQAISNELNHVLHQQHYDTLPCSFNENNSSMSNDLISLKNSIYRSRELSRIQSKEMHDLDLSLREMEVSLGSKYDELKFLEHETSSNILNTPRSQTPNYFLQQTYRTNLDEQSAYDTLDIATPTTPTTTANVVFSSIKEIDEDSGINSLTSDDSNHHSMSLSHQKLHTQTTQLETLV